MKSPKTTIIASLLAVAFLAGCADGPLAPKADLPLTVAEAKSEDPGASAPEYIHWIAPLSQDITQTTLCLAFKPCVVKIDAVGAKIVIPRWALEVTAIITMTAVAGEEVDFRFSPHGLEFEEDVRVKVEQIKTTAVGSTFTAYYHDDLGNVLETIEATTKNGHIDFSIEHFSGYALGM